MQHCKYSTHPTAIRPRILPGMLLVALSVFSATPARAQAASAVSHPPTAKSKGIASEASSMDQHTLTSPKGITPLEVTSLGSAKMVQPLDANQKLRLVIALRPPKLDEEEKFLKDLQTKGSPSYGKFLTAEEWNARFAPSAADEQAVIDWATAQGLTITGRFPNRMLVDVEAPVSTIEKTFKVSMSNYMVNGKLSFSNDRDPEIPSNLVPVIQNVQGLNNIRQLRPLNKGFAAREFPTYAAGPVTSQPISGHVNGQGAKPKSLTSTSGVKPNITNGAYDPTDIYSSQAYDVQALYNQGHCCNPLGNSGSSPKETSIAIATAGSQDPNDFQGFHNTYPYLAENWVMVGIDGQSVPCNPSATSCDGEGTMDFEWSTAMSNSFGSPANTATVVMYDGVDSGFGTFDDIYNRILSDNSTRIMSTSWGCTEGPDCYDQTDMNSAHNIFAQMLGQGWTLIAASGDKGATANCDDALTIQYPSADPYIVAAGGTTLALNSSGQYLSETAWGGGPRGCASNDGGSTGGVSKYWSAPGYQTSNGVSGYSGRAVPDLALNADWYNTPQNLYFGGGLGGNGGTSIVAPELAGMFAQFNAYLLAVGVGGAPIGDPHNKLYWLANHAGSSYESHYPFYDITGGCNNNDITAEYDLGFWCATTGYDPVTGLGSVNALQLSWGIGTYDHGDFTPPTVNFSGPLSTIGGQTWFRTDQTVSFSITDNGGGYSPTGVAGYSAGWDVGFSDPTSEATPGSGNSFYSGPQHPNATSGSFDLASAGQGCHYAAVDAWDNTGFTTGNQFYYYLCYDTIAPTVGSSTSPGPNVNGWHNKTTTVTVSASDPGGSTASGIAKTYYSLDSKPCSPTSIGTCTVYSSPVGLGTPGHRIVNYFTEDKAGNFSSVVHNQVNIDEVAPVTKATLSGTLSGSTYVTAVKVTLAATDDISGVQTTTYTLDGGSAKTYSGPFTVSSVGSHTVKYFSVDRAGNTETTKTVGFPIKSPTATTLTVTPTGVTVGSTLTLKAVVSPTLSGTPTGNVVFKHGTTVIGTVALSGGVATFTTSGLPQGSYSLTASYGGASYFVTSVSPAVTESVLYKTTTTVTATPNPSHLGQNVTFTAKVAASAGGVPTGTVTFAHGTVPMGSATLNSSGIATFTTNDLSLGGHTIWVDYTGSSKDHTSGAAGYTMIVNQATTTTSIASSPNPAKAGQTITFSAKVTAATGPAATGTVTFRHGNTAIGTGTLNSSGVATVSTPSLAAGQYSVTAEYNGTTNDATSVSVALVQTVNK